jgi:hypothetical protein
LNNFLPRGEAFFSGELGIIVKEHRLSKAQVSRQLLNFKRERFGFQQVAVIMHASDLEGRICEGMLLSPDAFVAQTLSKIHLPGNPSYGLDLNNICAALSAQPPMACTFVKLLAESLRNTCSKLLVDVVENWIKIMADTFPKTAAGIQNAQIDFDRGRELKLQCFAAEFMEEYDASGFTPLVITKIGFGNLGRFLHHVIFLAWSHSVCSNDKPPIKFPVDCLVGKHARPVIYYFVDWMLYSASKALTVARDKRQLFLEFSMAHSIDEDIARSSGLPTSLVERRKRNSSVYCSHDYFEFICSFESVYLANLTLKMIMAYADGDIIARIKMSIIGNQVAKDRFAALLGNQFDECKCHKLMGYILEQYANMRGNFFVRHLKGNSGDQIKKLADSQATRTKVANAVVCNQKISVFCKNTDDSPEVRELWMSTTDSVIDHTADYLHIIKQYCFLLLNIFTPKELLPLIAMFAMLKVLAFLSTLSKPAAVSLLVLLPTICLASRNQ